MPNRILRAAMLDSERYLSLSSAEARLLFVELILLADDYGLLPAGWMYVARRTSVGMGKPRAAIETLLQELADADLIRLFTVDNSGEKLSTVHAYIPRFGNSPRSLKPLHPMPPDALGGNEIKDLREKRIADAKRVRSTRTAYAPETETETETETVNTSSVGSSARPEEEEEEGWNSWEPTPKDLLHAVDAGLSDDALEQQARQFREWHAEAKTQARNRSALWRLWVQHWREHKAAPTRDQATATAAYLAQQREHRAQATPPPPQLLALVGRKAKA